MALPVAGLVAALMAALTTFLRSFLFRIFGSLGKWLFSASKSLWVMLAVWITDRLFAFLASLGLMGFVYIGVDLLISKVVGGMMNAIGGAPDAVFQILMLSGFGEAFNIIISAIAFAVTMRMSKVGSTAWANTP